MQRFTALVDDESYYQLQVFMPLLPPFLPDDPVKGAPWTRLRRIAVVIN